MGTWPVTLPQKFEQEGFEDTEPNLFMKTEMDAGPPKLRKRFTAGHRPISGRMLMTATQKATFRTFYLTYGSSQNTFPDPDGGSDITIIFLEEPTYVPTAGTHWVVSLKLAVMP